MEKDTRKYYGQQCQDDKLNHAFRQLHVRLVDEIASFCRAYRITIDEFSLSGDGFEESCKAGHWVSATDSGLTFRKFSDEYKDAFWNMKIKDKNELDRIENESKEPFMFSM